METEACKTNQLRQGHTTGELEPIHLTPPPVGQWPDGFFCESERYSDIRKGAGNKTLLTMGWTLHHKKETG